MQETRRGIVSESHAVIFEYNGTEKIRFLNTEIYKGLDEEKAKELLFEEFGFANCKIIQID